MKCKIKMNAYEICLERICVLPSKCMGFDGIHLKQEGLCGLRRHRRHTHSLTLTYLPYLNMFRVGK